MTHDPYHSLYFVAGGLYFALATYFSIRNYEMTDKDGFWFFMTFFSLSMTGVMIAGGLWSLEVLAENIIHPYYDIFFLVASILLLDATYTLSKKQHKVRTF
jgi:formate hydrogenlyase subunit 3/multisubunit Na+/H+ antiporter MnhD subunit